MSSATRPRPKLALLLMLAPLMLSGCAMYRNSIPASCVRPTLFDAPRSSQEPINFLRLRQDPPAVYLLGPRDVLGIYIEGVLGNPEDAPPVHFSEDGDIPPAIGYPIPIREDGTISLPLVPAIYVEGLTLAQAEAEIRRAYTMTRRILQPGRDRTIVTLMRRRTYQVLVIREDETAGTMSLGSASSGGGNMLMGPGRRGMAYVVELPAYENDVLHALSESGGLPGLDAENVVVILRGGFNSATGPNALLMSLLEDAGPSLDTPSTAPPEIMVDDSAVGPAPAFDMLNIPPGMVEARAIPTGPIGGIPMPPNANVVQIPLRAAPGEPLPLLTQEEIVLQTGDIIFIRSREAEVFYTGGLLRGGQFLIPRDYDLDVLGAISMSGGSLAAGPGSGGGAGFMGGGASGGVGSLIPPTQVIIVRTVNGRQFTIRISLKRALLDPNERILIQPNDIVMLQYTPMELMMNLLLSNLQFNYFLNDFGGSN